MLVFPSCYERKVTKVRIMELYLWKRPRLKRSNFSIFYWQVESPLKHLFQIVIEPLFHYIQRWETHLLMNSTVKPLYKLFFFFFFMLSYNWLEFLPTDSSYILCWHREEVISAILFLLPMATLPQFRYSELYLLRKGTNLPFSSCYTLASIISSHHLHYYCVGLELPNVH